MPHHPLSVALMQCEDAKSGEALEATREHQLWTNDYANSTEGATFILVIRTSLGMRRTQVTICEPIEAKVVVTALPRVPLASRGQNVTSTDW